MAKFKKIKQPTVSGISPELKLTAEECKKLKIDPVLCGLKVKHWTNVVKLGQYALKNKPSLNSGESTLRTIMSFFQKVSYAYSTNIALSMYSDACKKYLTSPDPKAELQKAIAVQLDEVHARKAKEEAQQEADKFVEDQVHSLRSKTKAQKKLANAAKVYQTAKFEADSLMKNLGVVSNPSSQENVTLQPLSQRVIHEHDDVFTTENKTESIGQRIKQEAINIHDNYVNEMEVSTEAKLVMELGLSSILDLTNEEDAHQKYIFSNQEWEQLEEYFNNKYRIKTTAAIPEKVITTWSTVAHLAVKKGTFTTLQYISKIQSLETTSEIYFIYLEIFRHVISTIHRDASLINSIIENTGSISEQDVYTIWFPIIKSIVSMKKITRMKQGETVNEFTTKRKQIRYYNHEKIKGFKIDVRLLLDYHQHEIDLCAGEVAINAFDKDKVTHDRSKLIRESKEICDHHIEAGLENDSVGWGMQICGLEMRIVSTHLFREGLYVAVCQDKLRFPQNTHELSNFIDALKGLVFLIEHNEAEATEIIGLYDKIYKSYSPSLNRDPSSNSKNTIITAPTHYTPPSKDRTVSVIPTELFINAKRQLFQEKIIIGEDPLVANTMDAEGVPDTFGWVELNDNTWFNVVTGEKNAMSPYD